MSKFKKGQEIIVNYFGNTYVSTVEENDYRMKGEWDGKYRITYRYDGTIYWAFEEVVRPVTKLDRALK